VTYAETTWVNIERPKESDIACLKTNYPFHPLDLADCLSRLQRPKLDVYQDYLFLIFHYSVWEKVKRVAVAEQISVFLGSNYVITVHNGRFTPLVDLFRQCQSNEQVRKDYFANGSGFLLYTIIDRSVDSYFPILDKLLAMMDKVEDSVFDETVEAAKEVFILRRDIITQRRIMFPNRTTFGELEPKLARFSKIDLAPHFGDVMDHMGKICETLDELKEIIDAFKDTDYVLSTNRIKGFLRLLTILGSIAVPVLVISSIFSMNIYLPFSDRTNIILFVVLLVIMGAAAGLTFSYLRRKRWI
jgi:magnesium transporter